MLAVVVSQEDELSEQQIRVGLIEKRLDNATKEADDRVDKIQHKLDEANFELKRKEKSVKFIAKFIVAIFTVWAYCLNYCNLVPSCFPWEEQYQLVYCSAVQFSPRDWNVYICGHCGNVLLPTSFSTRSQTS